MTMTHEQQLPEPPDTVYTVQHACRACGAAIEPFLALGDLPLANALVSREKKSEEQPRFPLTMARCVSCALVQLLETVRPEHLFRHYNYASSNSSAFVRHAKDLVERLIGQRGLNSQSQIVEIASNDGYLLDHYRAAGVPVLGVEPAVNIAHMARERGIETICEFFSPELAIQLARAGRTADVIHANNVLAHVPDLRGVVAGISALLRPDGIAVIEVPFWCDLVDRLAFDTVYHEHLFYFALSPLVPLFALQGLTIVDVERITVHGGSLRIFAQPGEGRTAGASVAALLAGEAAWGVNNPATYERFAADVSALRQELRDFLARLRHQGKTIAAYGAAAKGATLLNYCGIGRETIDFVVDRSSLKQGLAMPGVEIPVLAPGQLMQRRPDYLLLLAWNFADEIVSQQVDYARAGGSFILPMPHPRVIG
jgi:SAM-dependent methyltransferase